MTIYLDFSGGLDSSALLYCLKHLYSHSRNIIAINRFHPDVDSSIELDHAQAICQQTNTPLIKLSYSKAMPFSPCKNVRKMDHPSFISIYGQSEKMTYDCSQLAEGLFLSGHGGDHAFFAVPPYSFLSDLAVKGEFRLLIRSLTELCIYNRTCYLSGLSNVLSDILHATLRYKFKENFSYKPSWYSLLPTKDILFKGMGDAIKFILPSKHEQILQIRSAISSINVDIRSPREKIVYPLISQPILELLLGIESHHFFSHQYDRILLRRAIQRLNPQAKIWRKEKGDTTGNLLYGIRQNVGYIKDMLIKGRLSKLLPIDLFKLEQKLNELQKGYGDGLHPFINAFALECYIAQWDSFKGY